MSQVSLPGSVPVIPLDKIPDAVGLGSTLQGESFSANQWTGFKDLSDILDKNGNFLVFSPGPEGLPGLVTAGLIAAFFNKLSKTEKGQKLLVDIIETYINSAADILQKLHDVNGSNAFVALFQNRTAVPIYKRLGLISPKDASQMEAWLDHCLGEMLKVEYIQFATEALKGAETLVNQSASGAKKGDVRGAYEAESASGLAAIAKVLSAGA